MVPASLSGIFPEVLVKLVSGAVMLLAGRLRPVSEGQGSAAAPAQEPQLLGGKAASPSAAPSSGPAARLPRPQGAHELLGAGGIGAWRMLHV